MSEPDLKTTKEAIADTPNPGWANREQTKFLLGYIDQLLENYEELTQREMSDLNLIDQLKEKLVEDRARGNYYKVVSDAVTIESYVWGHDESAAKAERARALTEIEQELNE